MNQIVHGISTSLNVVTQSDGGGKAFFSQIHLNDDAKVRFWSSLNCFIPKILFPLSFFEKVWRR